MRKQLFQSIFLGGLSAIGIMVGIQKPALAADNVKIEIVKNGAAFVFDQPAVTIKKGQSIVWDAITPNVSHQLVPDTKDDAFIPTVEFKRPTQPTQTFQKKEVMIHYHCAIHPTTMVGTITVE